MRVPIHLYVQSAITPSTRPYRGLPEPHYPFHDKTIHVTCCGRICLHRKKINLSTVFAGQAVDIKEVDEGIWLVSFMDYDLGYIDLAEPDPKLSEARPVFSTSQIANLTRLMSNLLSLRHRMCRMRPLYRGRFDEAVIGFDRQPVSHVFGDNNVERTLDSFRFCLCPQRPLGALELSRVQLKMFVGPRLSQSHVLSRGYYAPLKRRQK